MNQLAIITWFIAAIMSVAAAGMWLDRTMQTMDQTITSSTLNNKHTTS